MHYDLVKIFIDNEIKEKTISILESGKYIKGPETQAFEMEFSKYNNSSNALTTSSGTTALHLIYYSLGIKKKDEIIVPSHTFIATISPALHLGATPVFAEINSNDYTLDIDDVRKKISKRTRAVIAVHLYGHPVNLQPLKELCDERNLLLIEDACQAHGAEYKNKKVGNFGIATAFSFFPSKVMTVGGDGGMIITNDNLLYEKMKILRDQGRINKYEHIELGFNFRMSEILAGIGRIQLKHLNQWITRRNMIASIYSEILNDFVDIPIIREWAKHAFYVYTIKSKRRDDISLYLKRNGIQTGIYYPIPVHQQPIIKELFGKIRMPNTEKVCKEILSLPMHPFLKDDDVIHIANKVNEGLK